MEYLAFIPLIFVIFIMIISDRYGEYTNDYDDYIQINEVIKLKLINKNC